MITIRDDRRPIKNGTTLELFNLINTEENSFAAGSSAGKFTVESFVGRGGTALCYEAVREDETGSKRGRLKEIFPYGESEPYFFIQRDEESQHLQAIGDQQNEQLQSIINDIRNSYRKMDEVKSSAINGSVLNNFIPDAYLYLGKLNGQITTMYIWTPSDRAGMSFDRYLESLKPEASEQAAQAVQNILTAVIALTGCIAQFHDVGLLHLDIKPSNFLVCQDRNNEINASAVSLFDINTMLDTDKKGFIRYRGTPGFSSPTVHQRPDVGSDIYSIAATLYYALSMNADNKRSCYEQRGVVFANPTNSINNWVLLENAGNYLSKGFREQLVEIFRKGFCLGRGDSSFRNCDQLLDALKRLRGMVMLPDAYSIIGPDQQLVLIEKELPTDNKAKPAIQKMLYDHPLYESKHFEGSRLNVLVIGTGKYACDFIDSCLQSGQMLYRARNGKGKERPGLTDLKLLVVSPNADSDMENFVRHRPALKRFFNVNGSLADCSHHSYGALDYMNCAQACGKKDPVNFKYSAKPEDNADIICSILKEMPDVHYVFVALGEDKLTRSVAESVRGMLADRDATVVFVRKENTAGSETPGLVPLDLHEWLSSHDENPVLKDSELERMAFNTHLAWNYAYSDMASIRRDFEDRYNYCSSLEYALSLKYKLHGMGIDIGNTAEAAEKFSRLVLTGEDNPWFDCMVNLEHRRWVTEKITLGWDSRWDEHGQPDVSYCVNGDSKDRSRKLHTCLVRSEFGRSMKREGITGSDWDTIDLDLLDELDRVSVLIHRTFRSMVEEEKNRGNSFNLETLNQLEPMVNKLGDRAMEAYNNLRFSASKVLGGNSRHAWLYSDVSKRFAKMVKQMKGVSGSIVEDIVKAVEDAERKMYIYCGSLKYEDFKSKDEAIIRGIPFILTRTDDCTLVVPFTKGSIHEAFRNVASATLLMPRRIIYPCICADKNQLRDFAEAAKYVNQFFISRNIPCRADYLVAYDRRTLTDKDVLQIAGKADISGRSFSARLKPVACSGELDAIEVLDKEVFLLGVDVFEVNESPLVALCVKRDYPCFQFDPRKGVFHAVKGCRFVEHISVEQKHALTVDDMFAFGNAISAASDVPYFHENYTELWEIFRQHTNEWKRLCNSIDAHIAETHKIRYFRSHFVNDEKKEEVIYLPEHQRAVTEKIINQMSGGVCSLLDKGSGVSYGGPACIKVTLVGPDKVVQQLCMALEEISETTNPQLVTVVQAKADQFNIVVEKTQVDKMQMTFDKPEQAEAMIELLEKLADDKLHLIAPLRRTCDKVYQRSDEGKKLIVSLRFTSLHSRKLLSRAGRLLEVYTYYRCKETAYFDDIVCGQEINWERRSVVNEIDCVLTKGFNTVIIECKTTTRLTQNAYTKLAMLANQFGINVTAVMVAESDDADPFVKKDNRDQSWRGERFHIVTIDGKEDINNIGETLKRLMEEIIN